MTDITSFPAKSKPAQRRFIDLEGRCRVYSPNTGIRQASALDIALFRKTGPHTKLTGWHGDE